MGYYSEIFERVNIQHIRGFIHYGGDVSDITSLSYKERIESGEHKILERLKAICPEQANYEQATNDLSFAFGIYEDVYLEIGMKIGARLIMELLKDDFEMPKGKATL